MMSTEQTEWRQLLKKYHIRRIYRVDSENQEKSEYGSTPVKEKLVN